MSSETQLGSCEPCKRKKCKCDRQLPSCGQCVGASSLCKYSENNKRGIPSGYLNALEQRLNDTEIALHEALSELGKLRQMVPYADQPRQPYLSLTRVEQLSKATRMAEWKQYPLGSSQDIERWWQALRTAYSREDSPCRDDNSEILAIASKSQEQQHVLYPAPTGHEDVPGHHLLGTPPSGGAPQTMSLEPSLNTHGNQFQTTPPSLPAQALVEGNFDDTTQPAGLNMPSYNACVVGTGDRHAPSDRSWNINQASKLQPRPQMLQRLGREGTELHRSQHLSAALNHIYY